MNSSHLPPINWGSILKRLTGIAAGWFHSHRCFGIGEEAILRNTGVAAKDLAATAAQEFCNKAGNYKPKTEEQVFAICFTIMKRDFLDLVKRYEYRKSEDIEALTNEDGEFTPEHNPVKLGDYVDADAALMAQDMYKLAGGEQDLIDLVDAVTIFDRVEREEIAELLSISVDEVKNRQRRMKYRRNRRPHQTKTKAKD